MIDCISVAIGGTFAKPSESFPTLFSPKGVFGAFPYLLPNLICAGLLLLSILAGYLFIIETHPDIRGICLADQGLDDSAAGAPLAVTAGATAHAEADLRAKSYGTFNDVNMCEDETWNVQSDGAILPTLPSEGRAFTGRVTMLVIALGIFTYHSMTYDHLLPIFLQDKREKDVSALSISPIYIPGGLGLTTQTVGLVMSVNGVIALVIQAIIFPLFAEWLGIWRVFVLVTVLHPIAYFIVPFIAFLPASLLFPGIYTCLAVRNFLSILAYPVLLILIKQASPSLSILGKINGLAASAGAASRTVAPPIAGYLYSIGSRIRFTGLAWWASALVAIIGATQLRFIQQKKNTVVSITGRPPCFNQSTDQEIRTQVIHIIVNDDIP
jgi:hypothetical protein